MKESEYDTAEKIKMISKNLSSEQLQPCATLESHREQGGDKAGDNRITGLEYSAHRQSAKTCCDSLLEALMSLGGGDTGWMQRWQRQSFPLKVTRSPAGNGCLHKQNVMRLNIEACSII